MRVLLLIHQFMPEFSAGTERVTLNIAKALQRGGHHVEVLTTSIADASLWLGTRNGLRYSVVDGIPVHGIAWRHQSHGDGVGMTQDDDRDTKRLVAAFLDRGAYDIVHVTHSMRMLPVIDLVRDRSIPYIMTLTDFFLICHRVILNRRDGGLCGGPEGGRACREHCLSEGVDAERITARLGRLAAVLSGAVEVTACSPLVADAVRREHPDLPIRVVGHGIDLLRFAPARPKPRNGPIVFGYMGTLSEPKGLGVLVKAFVRAAVPNARLELVGSSRGNESFIPVLEQARSANITVRDVVPYAEVPGVLAGFDVLCLPSLLRETFSLAMHEGFAAGLPSLVSDSGWPAEVVRQADCGRAVATGDVEAWSREIRAICADPSVLDRWHRNIPLPRRVEEEGFIYDQLYRRPEIRRVATARDAERI